MEVKEKSRKRELIKTIAIVFLAVLLVLTLFSNTILNASLPEVATQRIDSGTINARIRGSGTVTATESYEVTIDQTREVRSILVRVGDEVQQGDVLFILEDGDSAELQAAEDQLRSLQTAYQRQLLTLTQSYTGQDRTIRDLREQLEKLTQQQEENLVTDEALSGAENAVGTAESDLAWIEFNLAQLNITLSGLEKTLEAAESELSYWDNRVSSLEGQGGGNDDTNAAKRVLESYWLAYENLYRQFLNEVKDYYLTNNEQNGLNDTYHIFGVDDSANRVSYIFKLSEGKEGQPPAGEILNIEDSGGLFTITSDQQKYIDAYLYAVQSGDTGGGKDSDGPQTAAGVDGQRAYTTLLNAYNTWQSALSSNTSGDLAHARGQQASAQSAVDRAQQDVNNCRGQITASETSKSEKETEIERLRKELEDLQAKRTAWEQAAETISGLEQDLSDALEDQNIGRQLNDLDLDGQRLEIQRQQETVEKLRADVVDTEVKANVSGTITAINVTAGREAAAGTAMATIDLVDRGYTVRISVTSEQARQVREGDTAEVANYFWGSSMEAVLEQIVADPDSRGQRRILVFRVTGDVDPGTNITLSIGQRSQPYNAIVPKSALREDTNGHFVLVVTSRSTPLGNRYTATRVDVEVLAEDDTSAAVSGVSPNDYVITTSSAPLSAGSQIRLAGDQS